MWLAFRRQGRNSKLTDHKLAFQKNSAISNASEDRLGIRALAAHIAKIANPLEDSDSLILGIEAEWGAGKTSLIELIKNEIANRYQDDYVVVEFAPWIIGNRDELLRQFFEVLIESLARLKLAQGDATPATSLAFENAIAGLKSFGKRIGPISKGLKFLGDTGIPMATLLAKPFELLEDYSQSEIPETSLLNLKNKISEDIKGLGKRFLIIVDDIDRLEPVEITEIFRLIRAVLDFENFTYALCYDKKIMWNALANAFGEEQSGKYLEKIIRVEIKVPDPERAVLLDILRDGLEACVGEISYAEEGEIYYLFQEWGYRYIKTPRSINRICDNVSFLWSGSRGSLYLPDLVWLSILKVGSPRYYSFVEDYVNLWSYKVLNRGSVSKRDVDALEKRFQDLAEQDGFETLMECIMLDRHLPGVNKFSTGSDTSRFLKGNTDTASATALKKLSSADYGRAYFALSPASLVPSDEEIEGVSAIFRLPKAEQIVDGLKQEIAKSESVVLLAKIERSCTRLAFDKSARSEVVFEALCEAGPLLYDYIRRDEWHQPVIWNKLEVILLHDPGISQMGRLRKAIQSAEDPSWVCDLFLREMRRRKNGYPPERIFSEEQYPVVEELVLNRLSKLSTIQVKKSVRPESIWFFWLNADENIFREYLKSAIRLNENFLAFFETYWTRSSSGRDFIERKDIESLMDVQMVERRVLRLISSRGELSGRALHVATKLTGWEQEAFGSSP